VALLESHPLASGSGERRVGPAQGVAATAVGVSLPERVVSSAELEAGLGLAPDWIVRRTGIRSRHVSDPGERLQSHAATAARRALRRARVDSAAVDLVIVATTTADEQMPSAAPLVAHELGAHAAGAFDVGAACTGFLTALAVGAGQIEAGRARTVVVIGADLMSRVVDPADRGTAAVFADGAGAVVLEAHGEASRLHPVVLGADGTGADHITIPRATAQIQMRGHDTFREAVAHLTLATEQAVNGAGLVLDDIDLFVYHQANGRILTAVGERLGLPTARVLDCIAEYGNTCAGTLPLALAHAADHDRLHDGDRVLLGAFGAGFTWGAAVLEWGRP
jgi:3-oxoacyl-[acyl-carrier-protein] synthase-3